MQYDIVLKSLLRGSSLLPQLMGSPASEWLNVEIPKPQLPRADILARLLDGRLYHLELQSRPEDMRARQLNYLSGIYGIFADIPEQHVLYVGERPWNEPTGIERSRLRFSYHFGVTDIRDLEAGPLLESGQVDDNLLAILCRLENPVEGVRRVVRRIAKLPRAAQIERLGQLLILSGLRRLGAVVEEEMSKVPITEDVLENPVIRKIYDQGANEGRQEGRREGEMEGARQEAASILSHQLGRRFGALPQWAQERIQEADRATLERWALSWMDAATLEDALSAAAH